MDIQRILSRTVLFSALSDEELRDLTALTEVREFESGQVVFSKGEPGEDLFVIENGKVRLELHTVDGKPIELGTLSSGEMFGELSVLDGGNRAATVTAVEASTFFVISRVRLLELIQRNTALAVKLLAALAARIRMTDALIEDTLAFHLPSKLAKVLLGLAQTYGQHTGAGVRINAAFPEAELAQIVGANENQIHKLLAGWETEGLVSAKAGTILIHDPNRLALIV